jgi:hypothetical protein
LTAKRRRRREPEGGGARVSARARRKRRRATGVSGRRSRGRRKAYKGLGRSTHGPRTGRCASLGLGSGGRVRGGDGRSWGMTGGPPLSASAGGRRAELLAAVGRLSWARWAAKRRWAGGAVAVCQDGLGRCAGRWVG